MRVLMVGAGGVGDAAARIAAERPFFESWVVADYDLDPRAAHRRRGDLARTTGESRFGAAQVDASDAGAVAALAREVRCHARLQRGRPAVRAADLRGRARGRRRLPRHGDEPVQPAPERALREGRRQARRRPAGAGGGVGGRRAGWPWSASASSRACPTCSPATPPTTCSATSTSWAPATAPTSSSATRRATRCSRPASRCGRSSRSASTRPWCGSASGPSAPTAPTTSRPASSPCRRSPSRRSSTSPSGIGPVECVHVEHEEVLLMPRWVEADKVTFKYGLGEEMIGDPAHAAHARPRRHRAGDRQGRAGQPARRRRRRAARPRHHRPADGGQDLRRAVGHRHRQGRPAAPHLPLPRVRQRRHDARLRRPVRRVADRRQPGRRAGAAGRRHLVAARACSARRRSTPCPFLDLLAAPKPEGYGSPWGLEDR